VEGGGEPEAQIKSLENITIYNQFIFPQVWKEVESQRRQIETLLDEIASLQTHVGGGPSEKKKTRPPPSLPIHALPFPIV